MHAPRPSPGEDLEGFLPPPPPLDDFADPPPLPVASAPAQPDAPPRDTWSPDWVTPYEPARTDPWENRPDARPGIVIPQGDALEDASRDQLEVMRAQLMDTPADLSTWRTEVPRAFPIAGLVQVRDVTLWSAIGGAGKSLVLFLLLCLLACGAGGLFLDTYRLPGRPVRCLLIEVECGAPRIRRRLRELVLGGALTAEQADLALENLVVFSAESLKHRNLILQAAPALALRYGAEVLAIDPLRVLLPAGVDENSNVDVGKVLDELVAASSRFGFATILVDHDNKSGGAARGASAKSDAAAFVLHLTKPDPDLPTYLEWRITKGRDPGAPPFVAIERLEGDRTPEGLFPVSFAKTTPRTKESRAASAQGRRERLAQAVREHFAAARTGLSLRRLAALTGIAKASAARDLEHLESLGVVTVTKPSRPGEPQLVYPASAVEAEP